MAHKTSLELDLKSPSICIGKQGDGTISFGLGQPDLPPPKEAVDGLKTWRRLRDLLYSGLTSLGVELWKPEGAFYVLPKVPKPQELVTRLYLEHKIIAYLGEWFGAPDRIRLSYALDEAEIEEGLEQHIGAYLREMGGR